MTTEERKNFKTTINEFFSTEDSEFYFIDKAVAKGLMVRQFNEFNEENLKFPYDENNYPVIDSEEMNILCEWIEENGWIINED